MRGINSCQAQILIVVKPITQTFYTINFVCKHLKRKRRQRETRYIGPAVANRGQPWKYIDSEGMSEPCTADVVLTLHPCWRSPAWPDLYSSLVSVRLAVLEHASKSYRHTATATALISRTTKCKEEKNEFKTRGAWG